MSFSKSGYVVLALLGILGLLSGPVLAAVELNASGSTFIYPIESKWANIYERIDPGLRINYQPNGSGAGIGQLLQGMTDFAGSDAPLSDKQLVGARGDILHFPAALGADVVAYNLPEIVPPARLRLTGPIVADIFLGKITKWNDPRIVELNPKLKLPKKEILTIHRSDGSGTTYIFVDYLSKVSQEWERAIGKGTTVKWPVGYEAPGNQGVTDLLSHTRGAIGYMELTFANQAKLPFAQIQNSAGEWIDPNLKSITIAADQHIDSFSGDFRISVTNSSAAGAYPISSYSFFLVYAKQTDRAKGEALKKFLQWVLHDGQTYARQLDYAPLPGSVIKNEEPQLQRITTP